MLGVRWLSANLRAFDAVFGRPLSVCSALVRHRPVWQEQARLSRRVLLYLTYPQDVNAVQGPRDMYLGLTGAVLGTIPTAMLYFTAYEWCKGHMERRKAPTAITHLASASAGAVLSSFIRVPTDTIKHRVQAYMETDIFMVGSASTHYSQLVGMFSSYD